MERRGATTVNSNAGAAMATNETPKGNASLAKSSEKPITISFQFPTALFAGSNSVMVAARRPLSSRTVGSRVRNWFIETRKRYPSDTPDSIPLRLH